MTYEEFKQNFLPEFLNINSYAGRIEYANQNLQRIGSGTGRIVYDIDSEKVLKLAKNAKGIAQNEAEAGAGYYRDTQHIVAEIFDSGDNDSWLISEKAKKVNEKRIKELTGIPSLNELYYFLKNQVIQNKGGQKMFAQTPEIEEFFWENEFGSDLIDFVINYSQSVGDMGKPSTYGEVIRDGQSTIVLTDYGLNDEVYDTHYNKSRKQKYRMYELFNYADGNDDILSDAGGGNEIRTGMWAQMPYSVSDGQGVFNEEFIKFVSNRNEYPEGAVDGLPILADAFQECVNNIKETLQHVENKKQFYGNLLELQNYLIRRGFYERDPLLNEEYQINEEIPPVEKYTLDDKNYSNELAKAVAGKLNLSTPRFLDGGANGFAYLINDNLVMKLTADVSEADAASKLIRGRPQYIATVFNLYKVVDTNTNQSFFVIMQENINEKPLDKFRKIEIDIEKIKPAGLNYDDFLSKIRIRGKFNYNEMVEMAKHVLIDNPQVNVSEPDRQTAYEFLIGILNIRKELLEYQIKSTDYSELRNLGYKNGVLKFFDTGGYYGVNEPNVGDSNVISLSENLNEEYPKERADLIAMEIGKRFGVQPQYINGGMFGVAYDIGNNKILKITKDNSEAFENIKLIGKPLKYIAEPYNVFEINTKSNSTQSKTYAIILEKLKTDPQYFKRMYERLNYAFNKILKMDYFKVLDAYKYNDFDNMNIDEEKIKKYFSKNSEDGEFFYSIIRIIEELRQYNIDSVEYYNPDNLGYKRSGVIGLFDVGFTDGLSKPNAEKIDVDVVEDGSAKFTTMDAINQDNFPPYDSNDTSPSINNDLDANIAMYEDLEYNHVVGDATDDKFEISEDRKKSWVDGSKAVTIKKKCQLGGNGDGTSTACNQGDINNLEFSSINEVGEGISKPYPITIEKNDEHVKIYNFTTEDNDKYFIEFTDSGMDDNMWVVNFGILDKNDMVTPNTFTGVVNKGRIYQVMATILKIMRGFFVNTKPDILVIEPTKSKNEFDNRRFSLYLSYILKNLPQEYEITRDNKEILIKKKNFNEYYSSLVPMNESNIPNKTFWAWVSPDNHFIEVPKLNHKDYIMRQYKDEDFGWDYDRVFDKALKDGWVRVIYEYENFKGNLSINGLNKERVFSVFKSLFIDLVKYGSNYIVLEWYNPKREYETYNTRNPESKAKLAQIVSEEIKNLEVSEYFSSLIPMNEDIMTLQDLPFKEEIEQLGGKIFSVGGAVRDEFLGKKSKDLDVLVTGIPMDKLEQLLAKYGGVNNVGASFGVLKFVPKGSKEEIDIAIPRTETPTGEGGHKGFEVTSDHALPIEKDLERRDFTINAIAKDAEGNIVDPYGGQEDLKNKIIRIVNPKAFSDDPLRMLRAVQFASRFGFTIEPRTMQMIIDNAAKITEIAPERILIELDKIITKGNPLIGVQLLASTGLFKQIFGNEIKPSQIGRRDFSGVRTMGELLFLMMNGVVQNPAEFYLNRFSTEDAKRDKIYKELQALDLAFNSDLLDQQITSVKARSIAHNMYKIASQTLESQIIPEEIKNAAQELLQGKYPKTVNDLAVNGIDIQQKGLQGKAIGDMQKALLIRIYADNVRNDREELLSLLTDKNNEMQEGYPEYNDLQPATWDVNDKQLGIDFFVQEYDKWNNQGGTPGYRNASKESVLEFLQNNYEDFSVDEKLKKQLYWALTDRDLINEREEQIEYGALMLFLDVPIWKKITSIIKKDDIYEKNGEFGIEVEPHVTILYGFHDEVDADEVFELYKKNFDLKPIKIGIEGISTFENEEFDVVKMDVDSEILSKMNSVMRKLPNTTRYPEYHAHITLAYVKKGCGKDYVKKFEKNRIMVGNELVFSTKKEKQTKLMLSEKGLLKENVLNEMSINSISFENIVTLGYINDLKSSDNYERYLEYFKYEYGLEDQEEELEQHPEFESWLKSELYDRYEEIVNNINNKIKSDGTINIWREMSVKEDWLKQLSELGKHLGICWSWDEHAAEAHWGHSGGIKVLIKSSVHEKYINWNDTIILNMDISLGEDEKEIRLFKNTKLKIEELYVDGENVMDTPEGNSIKNKTFLAEEVKKVNYSAVVLDDKSRARLIKVFQPMIPKGWEVIADHMTIKMGALENGSHEKQDMEDNIEITLKVLDYAMDDLVMAVGVKGYPTTNAKPHITIAVNRTEGGKPFMSNKLTDWKPLGFPLTLTGKVNEE